MPQAILLLTRPQAQSRRVLAELQEKTSTEIAHLIAPVLRIEPREVALNPDAYAALILTSINGVAAAPDLTGRVVHCVGERTAEEVRAHGGQPGIVEVDAEHLLERLLGAGVTGPLLHLRGEHARGAVAQTLSSAGIETHEAVTYDQVAQPLCPDALRLIEGQGPLVLPLYSPRSAALVGKAAQPGPHVHVIALSQAVAQEYEAQTGVMPEVCDSPTGRVMQERIAAALQCKIA